jgi:hypothetical protein
MTGTTRLVDSSRSLGAPADGRSATRTVSCTYDGYLIVSQRFRDVLGDRGAVYGVWGALSRFELSDPRTSRSFVYSPR